VTSLTLCTFNNWEKYSSSAYLKYCGNLQADHHSHLSVRYFLVGSPS
jgi:hypothetical protein